MVGHDMWETTLWMKKSRGRAIKCDRALCERRRQLFDSALECTQFSRLSENCKAKGLKKGAEAVDKCMLYYFPLTRCQGPGP